MNKLFFIFLFFYISLCFSKENVIGSKYADSTRIRNILIQLTKTEKFRSYKHPDILNKSAKYIHEQFSQYCDSVEFQNYYVDGIEFKNVIGSIGTKHDKRIIVGAHYDVYGEQEGADDNGSGIAGLLELARLLSKEDLPHRIDFVAYTLEEPPFFGTEKMGSYIHAKSLANKNATVIGMVCLEMIGYFSDEEDSQEYPISFLSLFYGNKGNFITIVQKWGNGSFGVEIKDRMKKLNLVETKSFSGPTFIPGLDFSDHLNYWKFGYSAVMVTNTAFYRNKNYHNNSDTIETLDINRMGLVIDELFLSLKEKY